MKILSWNVNGIRSVIKKDFFRWLNKENPEILCLQEIKAQEETLPQEIRDIKNYFSFFNFAKKRGYSGVAVFSKEKPINVDYHLGMKRFDDEGRFIKLEFKKFIFIGIYLPHGGREKQNLDYKLEVYDTLIKLLKKIKKPFLIIGDFNIAHEEKDLARPKQNLKNIMFTIEERRKIDFLIKLGLVDTFRELHEDEKQYTWWPYFANARQRNLGWRIDYAFASKDIYKKIKKAFIQTKIPGSDHCPIGVEIK